MLYTTTSSKKRLFLYAVFMALFLLVLVAATFVLHRRARTHLDNELGARLKAVATNLAHAVEIARPDSLRAGDIREPIHSLLGVAAAENDLSNVVILTPDGLTVVDLEDYSRPGEPNPLVDLDFGAVTLARSGYPAYTNLYRSGDSYLKSAYAPIFSDDDEVIGVLGVEAGAEFFADLRELSRVIAFILGASVLATSGLGWFFFRQSVALDRAQEAMFRRENLATMGRMVANVAHDIRNPLSIINTSAERLRKKYKLDDEIFSYISEEVGELNRILTGYLDFAGSHDEKNAAHSAQLILRRCLMVIEPEVEAKRLELVQRIPSNECSVYGNDKRIQQAVLNVLLNAIQAVGQNGRIEMSLETVPPYAVFAVKDNGPGIVERDIKEITKPFYTNKAGGSGLGLSIVQTIVDNHGGRMDIESERGAGTEVKLSFPIAE